MHLRVSDLKQFTYCPRIIYYSYVLPVERRTSYKMEVGSEQHQGLEELESRRTLKRYGLDAGERTFRVRLDSTRHGLSGVLDLLIKSGRDYYPVEFKDSAGGPALHHRYQLAAYCLLVEETFGAGVRMGFLYVIPQKRIVPVPFTPSLRQRVLALLSAMRGVVATERMPPPTRRRGRCKDCEYRNYCGDWS
ncbi:MAG: CRISPR-associated protein Cas4 [Bacillota bacterium]|nr:MAG: CRISPR-associated protein Cas4 [Bacillota bacterium]